MAKKRNTGFPDDFDPELFGEMLNQLINFMSANNIKPEDMLKVMNQTDTGDYLRMLNDNCYHYVQPDYKKMAKPLHPALLPLFDIIPPVGMNEASDKALAELRASNADIRAELVNALYWILANQDVLMADDKSSMPFLCILNIMEEARVTGVVDVMLELLRQDAYFMEFFFGAFEEDASLVISHLCEADTDRLEDFMYETGLIPKSKYIVADGVIQMALNNPMLRIKVVAWLARVFSRYCDITVYETNIDHIVWSATQLNAQELVPIIKRLYDVKNIPFIDVPDKRTLNRLLKKGNDERRIEYSSLREMIANMEQNYSIGNEEEGSYPALDTFEREHMLDDDDEPGDDYFFDDDDDDDVGGDSDFGLDKPLLVAGRHDGSLFRLEVTLPGCPVNVVREIVVPSNISLGHLSFILVAAMGWNGSHLHQFKKGSAIYCSPYDLAEAWTTRNMHDWSCVALNEVLARKNSHIEWEYDYGDSWMHSVKVLERIKDADDDTLIEVTRAENACPPDDCGGIWGYEELLDAISDKRHPEHEEYKAWVGPRFNPHKVSLKTLNAHVKRFLKSCLKQ